MKQEDPAQLWSVCLSELRGMMPAQTFATWFERTKGHDVTPEKFTIEVPNPFSGERMLKRFHDKISQVVTTQLGRQVVIDYHIFEGNSQIIPVLTDLPSYVTDRADRAGQADHADQADREKQAAGEAESDNLYDNYTFENFVVGECNDFAHAASLAVVKSPGQQTFNPLVIYGGVGLGKTHLAQAIAHESKRLGTVDRSRYVTSEIFYNEFIESIQEKKTKEFAQTYRNVDLLIVDDIQFFCKGHKDRTQEEFFHTFDVLRQKGKQIVLTSDRIPKELSGLEERLVSRFEWGLLADMKPPDYETREAILQKKADKDGLSLSPDVIAYIADRVASNIRELEGAVLSLLAYASLSHCDITIEVAKRVLSNKIRRKQRSVGMEDIQKAAAGHYGVSVEDLAAKTRKKHVVAARQAAMYLCRDMTRASLKDIGAVFGKRDHTTVIHACQTVKKLLLNDESLQDDLDKIRNSLA
ncbi:MAG: chromosomal replication initiator protein DnaA [Gemmatimonadota bacterium]|nr:chromosomal replication initiator protein DnaA [Gemmatimonadota bacterium]